MREACRLIPLPDTSCAPCIVAQELARAAEQGRCFFLLPQLDMIDPWRRRFACEYPEFSFGLKVQTFDEFIKESWSFFGDGRVLISKRQRVAFLAELLEDGKLRQEGCPLLPSKGMVDLLDSLLEESFGLSSCDVLLDQPSGASEGRVWVWRLLSIYRQRISHEGLIEAGEVYRLLPSLLPEDYRLVMFGWNTYAAPLAGFVAKRVFSFISHCDFEHPAFACVRSCFEYIESMGASICIPNIIATKPSWRNENIQALLDHIYCGGEALPPASELRFAFSEARYSQNALFIPLIEEAIAHGISPKDIFIASPDGSERLRELAARLNKLGLACEGRLSVQFASTVFGAAMEDLIHCSDSQQLYSFLLSPFSGLTRSKALAFDRSWRGCRQLCFEDCLASIVAAYPELKPMFDAVSSGDFLTVVDCMLSNCNLWDTNYLSVETRTAASCARRFFESIQGRALSRNMICELLAKSRLELDIVYPCEGCSSAIRFGGLDDLARQGAKFALLCDFGAEEYPLESDAGALDRLLMQAQAKTPIQFSDVQRYSFYLALASVSDCIVMHRDLCDADGEALRPSALLEELCDCYRSDLSNNDALDKNSCLPKQLISPERRAAGLFRSADDSLFSSLLLPAQGNGPELADSRSRLAYPKPSIPFESQAYKGLVPWKEGEKACFSPSSIEAYANCPYRWLAERYALTNTLDALMGPLSKGNFVHACLKNFYSKLPDRSGCHRVNQENLPDALALMEECFNEQRRIEFERDSISYRALMEGAGDKRNRDCFVPVTESEKNIEQRLLKRLLQIVKDDADFLPGFQAAYLEYEFDAGDTPIYYAGHLFKGIVDRIDTDDRGRAVIIDYKGSLGADYRYAPQKTHEDPFNIPKKMQALIYAQVARRELGLQPVAALYRSYKPHELSMGVYDPVSIGADACQIRPRDNKHCSLQRCPLYSDFNEYLDRIEESVAQILDGLMSGKMEAAPRHAERSCKYCPVNCCPERKG